MIIFHYGACSECSKLGKKSFFTGGECEICKGARLRKEKTLKIFFQGLIFFGHGLFLIWREVVSMFFGATLLVLALCPFFFRCYPAPLICTATSILILTESNLVSRKLFTDK